jgi:hypothetical protein
LTKVQWRHSTACIGTTVDNDKLFDPGFGTHCIVEENAIIQNLPSVGTLGCRDICVWGVNPPPI